MNERYGKIFLFIMLVFCQYGFAQSNLFKPDISYAGIKLEDNRSVQEILGDIRQYQIDDSINPFQGYIFVDDTIRQYVRLTHYPGDGLTSFAWIEVAYSKYLPKGKRVQHKDFKNFTSESGIALGMKMDLLIKIKGKPTLITKESNLIVYTYKITNIGSSDFLSKYNMPEYNAIFYFDNDVLVKYDFGFVYP